MKKLLFLFLFPLVALAADTKISSLTHRTTPFAATDAMVWAIPGVSNYQMEWTDLTNVLAGFYDPGGAALAVQNFANGVSNSVVATQGYATGVSNNVVGVQTYATGVSNNVVGVEAYATGISNNVQGVLGYATGVSNNVEGVLTYSTGVSNNVQGVLGYATGVSNNVESVLGFATGVSNNVLGYLPLAGGTVTGPVLSASTSTNAPTGNEFPVANWVRSLFNNGILAYATTVIDPAATNVGTAQPVYTFASVIPPSSSRSYVNPAALSYAGSVMTTNTFTFLQGPVAVNAYMALSTGGSDAITVNPELYYSYDKVNWYGDYDCQPQSIVKGVTNLYQFIITFPAITATNSAGFYIERRMKVRTAAGTPTLTFLVGTNLGSGTANASHISLSAPNSAAGNAYLPNNQTFTGTNTFSQTIIGSISGSAATATSASGLTGSPGIIVGNITNTGWVATTGTNYVTKLRVGGASESGNPVEISGNAHTTASFSADSGVTASSFIRGSSSSAYIGWASLSRMYSPVAGYICLENDAMTGFGGLVFGTNTITGTRCPAFYSTLGASPALSLVNQAGSGTVSLNVSGTVTATNGIVLPGPGAYVKWSNVDVLTNPPVAGAGTAFLFAGTNGVTAEVFVMDGAGNTTQLSAHAVPDAPPSIVDDDDPFPNITRELNIYLGKVRWINRSRQAKFTEKFLTLNLNAPDFWTFSRGKTMTQWSNAAAYGKYTNVVAYLDGLDQTNKDIVLTETFAEYNTRLGLTNGNGLVKVNWGEQQTRLSNEVWAAFLAVTNQYTVDLSNWLAIADNTNPPPVVPVYVPRTADPIPAWLQRRGVQ